MEGMLNNVEVANQQFIQQNINNIIRMPLVYSLKQEGINTIRRLCNIPNNWTLPEMTMWYDNYDVLMMYNNVNRRELIPYIIDYQERPRDVNFRIVRLPIDCLTDNAKRWLLSHIQIDNNENFDRLIYNYYLYGINNNVRRDVFYVVLPVYNENLDMI
jgi:hypothetical protein